MRRWLAIAMAALVAVSIGGMAGVKAPTVQAGALPAEFTMSVDCNPSTVAIDSSCVIAPGLTTATVVLTNNPGGTGTAPIGAFNVSVQTNQATLDPPVDPPPPSGPCTPPKKDCNPDFYEVALSNVNWSCDPVLVDILGGDPTTAESVISCFNGDLGAADSLADGGSIVLFTISYNALAGTSPLTLKDVNVFNETSEVEYMSCNPVTTNAGTCNDADVTVTGATATPTNTPVPATATNTPCVVGAPGCPTATSLAFVTVTPTPCPVGAANCPTATPGTQPTTPGEATQPPPPPPPGEPAGTTGGRTGGRITLPDTGRSDDGGPGILIGLLAGASALGAVGIASGLWFNARRRQEED